jgi:hypothetical protein
MLASKSSHPSIHEERPRRQDHIDISWVILIKTIHKMKPSCGPCYKKIATIFDIFQIEA